MTVTSHMKPKWTVAVAFANDGIGIFKFMLIMLVLVLGGISQCQCSHSRHMSQKISRVTGTSVPVFVSVIFPGCKTETDEPPGKKNP